MVAVDDIHGEPWPLSWEGRKHHETVDPALAVPGRRLPRVAAPSPSSSAHRSGGSPVSSQCARSSPLTDEPGKKGTPMTGSKTNPFSSGCSCPSPVASRNVVR